MRGRIVLWGALVVLTLPATSAVEAGQPNRQKAMQALYQAYQKYESGQTLEGVNGIEAALALDPNLAYANIVRAEVAMKEEDWSTAQKYFDKGLKLLKQPNQPVTPDPQKPVKIEEVEGDAQCFLGYVYVKLAQNATRAGDDAAEQKYLELAQKSLTAGLKLSPGQEAKQLAQRLLRMFR